MSRHFGAVPYEIDRFVNDGDETAITNDDLFL
jgi:hypothetical protein